MNRLLTRGRMIAALALLVAAALGLVAATQPWGSVTLIDGRVLSATGQDLAGALTIMSLACAVLALVLLIAGRIWRYVLGGLALLLGGALIAHALAAQAGVLAALHALVAEATGIAGSAQTEEITTLSVHGTPGFGIGAGALAIVAALWVLASAHRWPTRAKRAARYERTGSGLAWDVMDDGEDPTR